MEWIPLSGEADLPRYVGWIDAALTAKTVKSYKAYRTSKRKAEQEQIKYRHEAKEAEEMKAELLKKAGVKANGSKADLYALIQNKHKSQYQSMVDTFQNKYGGDETQGGEPTDAEFELARVRVMKRKDDTATAATAATPSAKKKKHR